MKNYRTFDAKAIEIKLKNGFTLSDFSHYYDMKSDEMLKFLKSKKRFTIFLRSLRI